MCTGQWVTDARFGKQFKAETVLVEEPRTLRGLERYLMGAVDGVGPELARRLIDVRPSIKVLFMSGYNDDNVVRHGVSLERVAYLQKPFSPADLSKKIREVLGKSGSLTGAA